MNNQKPAGAERIAALVRGRLKERGIERDIDQTEDLRDAGLSSLDMVALVLALEAEFDLTIPEAQITPANFRTVAAIGDLIAGLSA